MLCVWLPMTKDLRNQGLSDCTVEEITNPVFDSNGKLGKALSEGRIRIPASKVGDIFNNNTMTVAFWYNNNTSSTSGNHAICGFSGNVDGDTDAVRIWDFFNYSVPTQFHWSMGTLGGGSLANAFPANTWVHVCVTWSAPTLKIYLDGVLKYTGSGSSNYTFNKSYYISFGHTPQKLNDFRIYDHCLSPMEVKELSKGLVLHYPLDNNGVGGENIFKKTREVFDNNGSRLSSTTVNNGLIIDSTAPNGKYRSWNIVAENGVNRGIYYTYTNSNISLDDLIANEVYTLSFWSRCSKTKNLIIGSLAESQTVQKVDGKDIPSSGNIIVSNKWERHSVTFKWISTSKITTCFYLRSLDETVTLDIASPKLEKGSKATPWCPNKNDALYSSMGMDDNIEYDTSGFGNNGTRVGEFSWSTGTPRYLESAQFSGSQYIRLPLTCGTISEAVTIACWGYEDNWNTSSAERLIGAATSSSGWCIGDYGSENTLFAFYANGSYNGTSGFKQLSSGWHHFVMTFDGLNLICYVDGEQVSKRTFSTKQVATGNYNIEIGRHYGGSYNFKGRMSDVRIYATALSLEDILSLYQASAYIDSQGNTFASSYVE